MKRSFIIFIILSLGFALRTPAAVYWTDITPFPQPWAGRIDAFCFTIGFNAYFGTGTGSNGMYKDFWRINEDGTSYTQLADYAGQERQGSYAFAINGTGYAGGGYDGTWISNNLYSYNPGSNTWTQVQVYAPGVALASTFTLNGLAYIVCGTDGSFSGSPYYPGPVNATYIFDPGTGQFNNGQPVGNNGNPNIYALARVGSLGFSLNGKGYVGAGVNYTGELNDFWEYSPMTGLWTQRANIPGPGRIYGHGFALSGDTSGFAGFGRNMTGQAFGDFYRFDPAADTWTQEVLQQPYFQWPGARWGGISYSLGSSWGYLGLGAGSYSSYPASFLGDILNCYSPCKYFPVTTITANGPTTFCQGGSVVLEAAYNAGYSYQWKRGNLTLSGATGFAYTATVSGDYWCNVSTYCFNANTPHIQVTVETAPSATATAGGPTSFCPGGSVLLSANAGSGLFYQWQNNGIDISGALGIDYLATAPGQYRVTVTSNCGSSTSNSIPVVLLSAPTASISAGGPTTFCGSGSVTLSANTGAGLTYQWLRNSQPMAGETNSSYIATSSGDYSVVVTNGCGSSTSPAITVTATSSSPARPGSISGPSSVCKNEQGVVYSINAVNGASGYTWSTPPGATIASGQGTTTVTVNFGKKGGNIKVFAYNDCGNSRPRSKKITVSVCRLPAPTPQAGPAASLSMSVYPNPATELITVHLESSHAELQITLFDTEGRVVSVQDDRSGTGTVVVPVGNLPRGMYLLMVRAEKIRHVKKVLVE